MIGRQSAFLWEPIQLLLFSCRLVHIFLVDRLHTGMSEDEIKEARIINSPHFPRFRSYCLTK